MTHSGRFDREYFCHNCHLQYAGYYSAEGGREPCPHCGTTGPCAVDNISHCYCWITRIDSGLGKRSGRSPWLETAWWREGWMKPEWLEAYRKMDLPQEPRMKATRYWQKRAAAQMKRKLVRNGWTWRKAGGA